jgi:hypothetical protein
VSLERRHEVLRTVQRVHPEESTKAGFKRDTCVFAAWTGREVLRRFGISAKAVAVRALVANSIAWEATSGDWDKLLEGDEFGHGEGGWVMLMGALKSQPEPGRWCGHLVLTGRNPDFFLDLTLDQANRPEKGIVFEPALEEVPRDVLRTFESGKRPVAFCSDSGARIAYAMIPGLSPASGRDWDAADDVQVLHRAIRDAFVDRVEARVREELG